MNLNIGNNIKSLRKAKGFTQEQLAEAIGISFQAVSKWENNIAMPDITLIPVLAGYFGVSTDELLGFDLKAMNEDVEKICNEAYKYRETDPLRGRQIIEEGLSLYPGNDLLLNNLLYVLDYMENPDETISIASKLIDKTNCSDVKYDALRFLAYAYRAKGDMDSVTATLEQIPEIYFTKLSEMAYLLTGKPRRDAAEKQKWISFEMLLQMMGDLAEYYETVGNIQKAIAETNQILALISALKEDESTACFQGYADFFTKEIERMKNINMDQ